MKRYFLTFGLYLATSLSLSLAAQNIGEKSLRKVRAPKGHLNTVAYTSLGHVTAGKTLMEIPQGTIIEARYAGNGCWIGMPQGANQEGVLTNDVSVKQNEADPMLMAEKMFSHEFYDIECPALGDKPKMIETFRPTKKVSLMDNLGDVIVDFVRIDNPETNRKTVKKYKYCGTYMPYYISLRYIWENDKATPIDEIRIYVGSWGDTVFGAYINGIIYNIE